MKYVKITQWQLNEIQELLDSKNNTIKSLKDKINDILELLQEIFKNPPWKREYNVKESRQVDLLPSKIQPGISWGSSNNKLSLVNKIKNLFNISGGSEAWNMIILLIFITDTSP